jgi:hypothetical protein
LTTVVVTLFLMTTRAWLPLSANTAQSPAAGNADQFAAFPWGDSVDGLQLRVITGANTESLTETQSLLYLLVQVRNVSNAPVALDYSQATYDFEYEVDGVWYAFASRPPLRTSLSIMNARLGGGGSTTSAVAPGSTSSMALSLPLAGRSPALRVYSVTANGLGRPFEPTPGAHAIRVRPGRALRAPRAPISNLVTVNFRMAVPIDNPEQVVSFPSAQGTALQVFRFARGPEDAQAFIRDMLMRPPDPSVAPLLITAATLNVVEPLPFYELALPQRLNAPNPSLPTKASQYHYLVRASDQTAATIGLVSTPQGTALNWVGPAAGAERMFLALQALAAMEQVRGGAYEPRVARVAAVSSTPLTTLWLHSSSGRPDLFYWPRDPDFRGVTKVERERVYTADEFLTAARTLPVAPRHDEQWAIDTARACAIATTATSGQRLVYGQPTVRMGVSAEADRIVWHVYFRDSSGASDAGLSLEVDEGTGSCTYAGMLRGVAIEPLSGK